MRRRIWEMIAAYFGSALLSALLAGCVLALIIFGNML